jgi:DNA-directed RNA polymerase specialized sigma24 family protein
MSPDRAVEEADFEAFVADVEPRLRRAFIAAYGAERGREATAEALAWAWEHWQRVRGMHNAAGYLYRVGQSRTRPRRRALMELPAPKGEPWIEPSLPVALLALSEGQRTAVVLVHGFGWTLAEVAELTGVRKTTVQNHLERGLDRLRISMEATDHA